MRFLRQFAPMLALAAGLAQPGAAGAQSPATAPPVAEPVVVRANPVTSEPPKAAPIMAEPVATAMVEPAEALRRRDQVRYEYLIETSPWFRKLRTEAECGPIDGGDLRDRCATSISAVPLDPRKIGTQPPIR